MKCDMHVHTIHSGMCTVPGMQLICRESYNTPEGLYETLKGQGMDLVTVTDHDSIDAAEALRKQPDFFLSEEITCYLPSGTKIHVGVYDITERDHIELQHRANDFLALHAYLNENELVYSANHIFSSLTGKRVAQDFEWFEHAFSAFETRNGCMLERSNAAAAKFARVLGKAEMGGSDAHAPFSLGSCWTEVAGARTKEEFLNGVRQNQASALGQSGSYWKLTRDVLWIGWQMLKKNPLTVPVLLLSPLAPVITAINYCLEHRFADCWEPKVLAEQVAAAAEVYEEECEKVAA